MADPRFAVHAWRAVEKLALAGLYLGSLSPLLIARRIGSHIFLFGRLPIEIFVAVLVLALLTLGVHVMCRWTLAPLLRSIVWKKQAERMATEAASHLYSRSMHIHCWTHPAPGAFAMSGKRLILCDRSTDYVVLQLLLSDLRHVAVVSWPAHPACLDVCYVMQSAARFSHTRISFGDVGAMRDWLSVVEADHNGIIPADYYPGGL